MKTKTIELFSYSELSDSAKESARQWCREGALDYDWWDGVFEDAKTIGALMGIEIEDIYFSGFCSQGDGACFTGCYSYEKGGAKAVRDYAPQDAELHRIARELQNQQRACFYQLSARIEHSGRYSHSGCTRISVCDDRDGDYAEASIDEDLTQTLREFMDWIYHQLEREYEWLMSDEQVVESIEVNDYTFTEDGKLMD